MEESEHEPTTRLALFHLAECHARLAETAYRLGDQETAWTEIEAALTCAKPTVDRHLLAALIARQRSDRATAAHQLDCALAQTPQHEQALALRALEWYETGHADQALVTTESLPPLDGRLRRFREAHERGDRKAAAAHLSAVATGYETSLL